MSKFELQNNGKVIGSVDVKDNNVKRLSNKQKLVSALLIAGGVVLSVLGGCHNTKENEEITQTAEETIEESLFDSNELYRADLFVYYQDNGDIYFVNSQYLSDNNLVPLDTIDTRYEFIVDFNDKLISGYREEHPEIDFSKFDKDYQSFRTVYEEWIDGDQKEAFFQKQYLLKVEEEVIKDIHDISYLSYMPEAIKYEDYLVQTYPSLNEDKKYTIEYNVPEGTTLSEIVDSYADNNVEYKETIAEIMANPVNNVNDPDKIIAGETLILPNVDYSDATDTFGYSFSEGVTQYPDNYTPAVELEQRYNWINDQIQDIYILSGDDTAAKNKEDLLNAVGSFKVAYDEYLQGNESLDILYDARSLCDTIELLTGNKFEIIFPSLERKGR